MSPRIGCCTDVPLGYGSPQIEHLLSSLASHYELRKPVRVCEPASPAFPPRHDDFPGFAFYSASHPGANTAYWYGHGEGQREYQRQFLRWHEVHRPDILVVTGVKGPALLEPLRDPAHRPGFVIYYALEYLEKNELDPDTARCHESLQDLISLRHFPEPYRRLNYLRDFHTGDNGSLVLLNAPRKGSFPVLPASERNGRVLFQSISIQWGLNYPEYRINTSRPEIGIDVYGVAFGARARLLAAREVDAALDLRFLGRVTNAELAKVRSRYAYSLVSWNPSSVQALHASPNKLFESIASGVPPICVPHPQCAETLRKHDCGILMQDWSYGAFCEALEEGLSVLGTARYDALVRNCLRAHQSELNWEAQFRSAVPLLPRPSLPAGKSAPHPSSWWWTRMWKRKARHANACAQYCRARSMRGWSSWPLWARGCRPPSPALPSSTRPCGRSLAGHRRPDRPNLEAQRDFRSMQRI